MNKITNGNQSADVSRGSHVPPDDYETRAALMTAQARAAILDELRDKFAELKQLAETDKFTSVRGVNVAREIGAQIELFTGHLKLLPSEFESLSPSLSDAPLEFAKKCLALHQKFPEPVENHAIAKAEWELIMVQLELLPTPERKQGGGAPPDEPVKEFLSVVIKVNQEYTKLAKEHDISTWPTFYRESFLKQGKAYFDLYQKALELSGPAA